MALLLAACAAPAAATGLSQQPVIDMHVHVMQRSLAKPVSACPNNQSLTYPAIDPRTPVSDNDSVACAHPIMSATTPAELRERTIAELRRHHVRRAVVMGRVTDVAEWKAAAPDLGILAGTAPFSSTEALDASQRAHAAGQIQLFAEVGPQYLGWRADDPRLEPFWALAESLDAPVGIHLGEGMPGQVQGDKEDGYRAALTSPFQLEAVLIKHPRLRLYVMHAASPLTEEMIAMLFEFPQLYVDIAANDWGMPRAQFYDQLKRLVDAGFEQRIMFGSDQTLFPQAIGLAIETIQRAPFLTAKQKREILYDNAARFLRLTNAEIARDHAPER